MKIDISKQELQDIRDIIKQGRDYYNKKDRRFDIGTKLIKKINTLLKIVHGHDCMGRYYLPHIIKPDVRSINEKRNR